MAAGKSYAPKNKKTDQNELTELKNQLKTGQLKNVYLLSGEERFLADYYSGEIKKAVLGDDRDGLNLIRFEGKTEVGRIVDACDTFPVFSSKKLVIVKNSNLLGARKKSARERDDEEDNTSQEEEDGGASTETEQEGVDSGNKSQEILKQYIPNILESTCLIFIEDNIDKRLGPYKAIQKSGLHVHFGRQNPDELVNWVIRGFRQGGKTINPDAAQYLVSISDPDMYALKNEIAKITMYTGDRATVDRNDVRAVATVTIKSVIFDLMDAVAGRDSAKALVFLDDMLSLKEPEQKILAMISKQTGEILKLKTLIDRHFSSDRISRYFPGKHPYVFRKLTEQAERSDRTYLENFLKSCADADTAYKSGRLSPRLSLELLVRNL